ncbi:sporulation inhibitor KapD [Poriferisphaera corsica]|uniref:Sporulation inhibitor KapD n=1 Tax=Poriferisphaera corsica TaxID=2528020 RepID=A0A517YTU9_9BACT|nr:3'-5' exonuclease [Poriferisphaera corsica]QDU33653.1 sporulation inhibitor KapD [Poriferisphaera corsica]
MKTAIVFDCEFLVTENAHRRFWCGPHDPDPVIAQIGAVKISLSDNFDCIDTFKAYVNPIDRFGNRYKLDPFFTKLTGIEQQTIDNVGVSLQNANEQLREFAEGAKLWSWGKDELNMMAISCYIAGIEPSIPAHQFDNACKLLLAAGMPYEDIKRTPSNALADYFELEHPPLKGHDALDDALSITYVIQHLLRNKLLSRADFA